MYHYVSLSLHFNIMEIMALNNDFFPETQLNNSMWTLRMSFPILIQKLNWKRESSNIDSYLCNLMSVEMRREFIQNMIFPYFSLQIMEHYMSQVFISLCLGKSPCHNFFDNIHRVSRTLMHLIDFKSLAIFLLLQPPIEHPPLRFLCMSRLSGWH